MKKNFLKTHKTKIINDSGKSVVLKGVNLGGWLMMEAYLLHAPNIAEQCFRKKFAADLGAKALNNFDQAFRKTFIREKDIRRIAQMGFNSIRVPFHYRLIEKKPFCYDRQGLRILDNIVKWAKKNRLWIILDLHAAVGSQNCDWHSDSLGQAKLWTQKRYQDRMIALWAFLADHYKDEDSIVGYDLLNEPVLKNTKVLNRFYQRLIPAIRRMDKNHILFIEGNIWSTDLKCLDDFDDDNCVLSAHFYVPLEFAFYMVPNLSYRQKGSSGCWSRKKTRQYLQKYKMISQKRQVPIHIGEFGVHYRNNQSGELDYLRDVLDCFKELGFHWSYWTYKAIKHNVFPDGLFSYYQNPPWVHREGPLTGWDTYRFHWKKQKKNIIASWDTDYFEANEHIIKTLRQYAK